MLVTYLVHQSSIGPYNAVSPAVQKPATYLSTAILISVWPSVPSPPKHYVVVGIVVVMVVDVVFSESAVAGAEEKPITSTSARWR